MFDREYLKRVAVYIIGTVAALAVVFLLCYHMWINMTSEIETMPAVPQTYYVTAEYDAWVFRDEFAVISPAGGSGTIVPAVRNGEKIGRGDLVASVYSSVPSEKIAELSSLRSQIRLLEGNRSSVIGGDLGIGDVMLSLTSSLKNNELSDAREISARLTALVAARAAGGGDTDTVISSLQAKEDELVSSFGASAGSVYSPAGGWYFSDSDGFENIFTVDAVEGITPEKLDSLLQSEPAVDPAAAGRIVRSYKWYIATVMSTADGSSFAEGDTAEITIPGVSDPLKFEVESVAGGSDGRTAVVFSCGILPEELSIDRHLTLEFTLREVEGFGIPKDAVRIQDGFTGVYTFNGVMAKFKKINILEQIDDLYIAEIQTNDAAAQEAPAVTEGTGEAAVTTASPVGEGTGRKDYLWLEVNEFIITKGKALHSGKVIG